jgi:hypothetical protein
VCNQGLEGFRGVNPGFTHFGGFRGVLGFGSYSPRKIDVNETKKDKKFINIRGINIILYIYLYRGGAI